jgi:glycerophosphoryl diester phosphodiesterase
MKEILEKLIIAHRGESFLAPENTLAAINLAWENGVKAVEIDIQLTSDNKVVVIHDTDTQRVGDRSIQVRHATLNELKKVDVGRYKGEKWKGEQIPTLAEVFQTVPADGRIIVEVKCGVEVIPYLVSEIKYAGLKISQVEMISFNDKVLGILKQQIPDCKMYWLLDLDYYYPSWLLWINKKKILKKVLKMNLDGINIWAGKIINENFVSYFKAQGVEVYTWTTNETRMAFKLLKMDVDAITTDRPEWLTKQLLSKRI